MNRRFAEYLRSRGIPVFEAGGIYWRAFNGILAPVPSAPCYAKLSHDEAKNLLKRSGAYLLRYSSDPCECETEWWYIVCDSYNQDRLNSKVRNQIKRGYRNCSVRIIDAHWLAEHGYECYSSAFSRYKNAIPVSKEIFYNSTFGSAKGPYEYWGVFVEDQLTGYSQCIIEKNVVTTNVIKYHPSFLQYYTSYALVNSMINHYVVDLGMMISNGTRSTAHDTNMQDFLLKLGFRKQFCRLNIVYQPWLKFTIQTLFPLRKLFTYLPDIGPLHKVWLMLAQEELQRSCQGIVSLQN